jgi:hypothetical protein
MAFAGADRAERIQGMKGLLFLSAHMAAVGGIMGLPGANVLGPIIGTIQNLVDDKHRWHDWEQEFREAIGAGGEGAKRSPWADFLYKGAPYALLGMDTSDRLGMGDVVSLAPFQEIPKTLSSQEKLYAQLGAAALGPSGGMLGKVQQAWGFGMVQHDWTRMAETLAPVGISHAMQAFRLRQDGYSNSRGDILMPPDQIKAIDEFYVALGVRPKTLADRAERASELGDANEYYKMQTDAMKLQYDRAFKAKDTGTLQDLRAKWQQIQQGRVEDKFKREPMSNLIKAPMEQRKRERMTIGGVESTKQDRMYLADLMFSSNMLDARELMQQ